MKRYKKHDYPVDQVRRYLEPGPIVLVRGPASDQVGLGGAVMIVKPTTWKRVEERRYGVRNDELLPGGNHLAQCGRNPPEPLRGLGELLECHVWQEYALY